MILQVLKKPGFHGVSSTTNPHDIPSVSQETWGFYSWEISRIRFNGGTNLVPYFWPYELGGYPLKKSGLKNRPRLYGSRYLQYLSDPEDLPLIMGR